MKYLILGALVAAILPAAAQDALIKILYPPADGRNAHLVDQVMEIVLQRPGIVKVAKADRQTLVVTVPEKVARVGSPDDVRFTFTFTLAFMRNGDAIGEAAEECDSAKMSACADQVASDLISANAIRR